MRTIFVHLPVTDIEAARVFYTGLGFPQEQRFSDAETAAFVIAPTILAMVMTPARFSGFLPAGTTAGDPGATVSVMNALSADSRAECDELLARALAHGGRRFAEPVDHDVVYGTSFIDPAGNVWEAVWMDLAALEE